MTEVMAANRRVLLEGPSTCLPCYILTTAARSNTLFLSLFLGSARRLLCDALWPPSGRFMDNVRSSFDAPSGGLIGLVSLSMVASGFLLGHPLWDFSWLKPVFLLFAVSFISSSKWRTTKSGQGNASVTGPRLDFMDGAFGIFAL